MAKVIHLLFPGQGSQYVGMGEKLSPESLERTLVKANDVLNYDLSGLMASGPIEELTLTQNTQPAILSHSVALFYELEKFLEELKEEGIEVKIGSTLGHSVGEYGALVAAGALSFEDGVKAVHYRGKFMQEAVPAGVGTMYALLKLSEEVVQKACEEASTEDEKVVPANFNGPGQIVVSGHKAAMTRALNWLEANHTEPFRAVELKVSAPFHSPLMKKAANNLDDFLNSIEVSENQVPYVANIDAKEYPAGTPGKEIKENLVNQVCGSVLWTQSFASLDSDSICVEVGPGKVLMGLGRKINRGLKVIPMDSEDWKEKLREALK